MRKHVRKPALYWLTWMLFMSIGIISVEYIYLHRVWLTDKNNQQLIGNCILLMTAIAAIVYAYNNQKLWKMNWLQSRPNITVTHTTTDSENKVPDKVCVHIENTGQVAALEVWCDIDSPWYKNNSGPIDLPPRQPTDIRLPPLKDYLRELIASGELETPELHLSFTFKDEVGNIYYQEKHIKWSIENLSWRIVV